MPEPCPFCGKPIVREYGSFRCKHCAGSSEDLIDLERKARVAEIRKQTRDDKSALAAKEKESSAASASPSPRKATRKPTAKSKAKAAATEKSRSAEVDLEGEQAKAPIAAVAGPTKSARLRMVATAHARIAGRKKADPDAAGDAPKSAFRKGR